MKEADQLVPEERASLAAYLLATLPHSSQELGDEEVTKREAKMDSGSVR